MDRVEYKQERFNEVISEVINILSRYGIQKDKICAIPISGYHGQNLTARSTIPELSWWTGYPWKQPNGETINVTHLVHAIDCISIPQRPISAPLRIPIQKVFKIGGIGTVAVGRVATGVLKKGDTICLNTVEGVSTSVVNSIEITHSSKSEVKAGDLVAFSLKMPLAMVHRGMVVSDPKNSPISRISSFTAQVYICNHSGELKTGYTPIYHCHTINFCGKWTKIIQKLDRRTGKVIQDNPPCLKQNDIGIVEIEPLQPVELESFTECAPLGRFVIRDGGGTVAFGTIKSIVKTSTAKNNKGLPNVKPKYLKK